MSTLIQIAVAELRIDDSTQVRAALEDEHVGRLAGILAEATDDERQAMALDVVDVDGAHVLAAGHHRREAHVRAGLAHAWCRVTVGSIEDARILAAGSNARHGLPLKPAERLAAVRMLRSTEAGATWTQAQIAKHVGVTQGAVSKMLAKISREEIPRNTGPGSTPRDDFHRALEVANRLRERNPWDLAELYVKVGLMLDADAARAARQRIALDRQTEELRARGVSVATRSEARALMSAVEVPELDDADARRVRR